MEYYYKSVFLISFQKRSCISSRIVQPLSLPPLLVFPSASSWPGGDVVFAVLQGSMKKTVILYQFKKLF